MQGFAADLVFFYCAFALVNHRSMLKTNHA